MLLEFGYGFFFAAAVPMLIGFPIASLLGLGNGMRAVGYAAALGLSVCLIVCRALQMMWPVSVTAWPLFFLIAIGTVFLWKYRRARNDWRALKERQRPFVCVLACAAFLVGVLLSAPVLMGHAVVFEGTRNADSFTFVSSARYMLDHAFHGAADLSPAHPIYAISRAYFGGQAIQPRPAAEGYLAWLSAVRNVDPMYLYNPTQAAGVVVSALSVLAFLPEDFYAKSWRIRIVICIFLFASPTLLYVAFNSNFATAMNLAAATAYVALALAPRSRGRFVASVLCLGSILSGYPEVLAFMLTTRGMAVIGVSIRKYSLRLLWVEAWWLAAELAVACALLPWGAWGTLVVYRTTLEFSHAGATDAVGDMYAGLPLFGATLVIAIISWHAIRHADGLGRVRTAMVAILVTFAVAQSLMVIRGYSYGGFKVAEYFTTLLGAVILLSVTAQQQQGRSFSDKAMRIAPMVTACFAAIALWKSAHVIRHAYIMADGRRVTADLVRAGQALNSLGADAPIALGYTPEPFYFGMWVPYVTNAVIAYDLQNDAAAAGYMSPYLMMHQSESAALFEAARYTLSISDDEVMKPSACDTMNYGSVHVSLRRSPSEKRQDVLRNGNNHL
ncbi:hypothetical protein [Dyella psychrodurans]|uniref:Glycosyltransferase RgtA/B/C/D-like domain-containing protein n=1 Tax=Dyella psychrodurans TaxID=1927960 RepID=A0A370WUH6_9GAMM|nr:hypothetical protein [Dyella psychrodurans]RDS79799.1 hypothetical protein DWU99_20595 [Dyella psychrodurans]